MLPLTAMRTLVVVTREQAVGSWIDYGSPMFDVQVTLDNKALRHTFVSHQPNFHDPMIVLTNSEGIARPNISARDKSFEYYDIMARGCDTYETVFRPIAPFTSPRRRDFPFGGASDEAHELKRNPHIDCRFPEKVAPGKLPWVQPQSVTGGRPLMHIKAQSTDSRLFGTKSKPATTIPHEYAHAIHFSLLSKTNRWLLAAKYGLWIAGELAQGRSGTHRTEKRTAPLIAYTEAIGIFSLRFLVFASRVRPDLQGAPLRAAFVADELSERPALAKQLAGYVKIADRAHDGSVTPRLRGKSTEGAIYGAIFLDLANRTSLADVVNLYLRCGAMDVGGFVDYARKQRRGALRADLAAVAKTWALG